MRVTTTTCDLCGKVKGETNHWFCIRVSAGRIEVSHTRYDGRDIDACGQQCVHKALDQWMVKGLIESVTNQTKESNTNGNDSE